MFKAIEKSHLSKDICYLFVYCNTRTFSDVTLVSLINNYWSFRGKVLNRVPLSCLVFAKRALFRENTLSLFAFLKLFEPFKRPLVIKLEMICRTKVFFKCKNISISWTYCKGKKKSQLVFLQCYIIIFTTLFFFMDFILR